MQGTWNSEIPKWKLKSLQVTHPQYLQSGPEVLQGSLGHLVYHGRVELGSYLYRQRNLSFLTCSEPDRKGEVETRYFQARSMEMKRKPEFRANSSLWLAMWLRTSCTELLRASFFSSVRGWRTEHQWEYWVGMEGKWNSTSKGISGRELCFFAPIPVRCGNGFNPFFS